MEKKIEKKYARLEELVARNGMDSRKFSRRKRSASYIQLLGTTHMYMNHIYAMTQLRTYLLGQF